jgi:hypothetical protein
MDTKIFQLHEPTDAERDEEPVVASGDRHERGVETLCVGEAA